MISTYPNIHALGNKWVKEILLDPVLVQEKVDGSQISFERSPDGETLRMRSKGAELNLFAPDKMFSRGVHMVREKFEQLMPGWIYRGEYLAKSKHNALAYDRVPANNIILFDIEVAPCEFLNPEAGVNEAGRLGFEYVPNLYHGKVEDVQMFRGFLDRTSVLGGVKVEGVVVKNYLRFGIDKKPLFGKFVSEAFKEAHAKEWKLTNPGIGDIIQQIIDKYRTTARWQKGVQHLREAGVLEDAPKDIAPLFKEIPADLLKEEGEEIRDVLMRWAWPKIQRGVMAGMPEWYKNELLQKQFEQEIPG
jgi:hypothetical protein